MLESCRVNVEKTYFVPISILIDVCTVHVLYMYMVILNLMLSSVVGRKN